MTERKDLVAEIGVVVGLDSEKRPLLKRGLASPRMIAAGGVAADAERAGRALVKAGSKCLLSFGVCGGLDDALRPGDMVVTHHVMGANPCAPPPLWAGALVETLRDEARVCVERPIVASDHPVATTTEKAALAEKGAVAVDMESGGVQAAAAGVGVAFLAIRAVVDDARTDIPPSALRGFGSDGQTHISPVIRSALTRPQDWRGLIRMGRDMGRAMAALNHAADVITRLHVR